MENVETSKNNIETNRQEQFVTHNSHKKMRIGIKKVTIFAIGLVTNGREMPSTLLLRTTKETLCVHVQMIAVLKVEIW